MLQFIREHPDILSKILKHISSSPIAEILLKLISISDREEANGIIEVYNYKIIKIFVRVNDSLIYIYHFI